MNCTASICIRLQQLLFQGIEGAYIFAGMDFHVDVSSPFTVTFETVHTQINIPITLLDDEIEEGYETFTLQLSYNETDNDGTVQITPEIAVIHIKDDDGKSIVTLPDFNEPFFVRMMVFPSCSCSNRV